MTEYRTVSDMTPAEDAVSLAAEVADERTDEGTYDGPGVWHMHFLAALAEQGWTLTRSDRKDHRP